MITGKDVRSEIKKAEKIVADEKASVETKLKAIVKLLTVAIKVVVNNRTNIVRIMEHLKIPKIQPTSKNQETESKE